MDIERDGSQTSAALRGVDAVAARSAAGTHRREVRNRSRTWARSAAAAGLMILAGLGVPVARADQPREALSQQESDSTMKIQLTIDGTEVVATLDDNATSRDFLALLPLTLTLNDYNGTEKVSDLPRRLSTDGAPEGVDPAVGDITYYAPWGNLALFYRDFGYARGLVRLGRIDAASDVLSGPGPLTVSIERAE